MAINRIAPKGDDQPSVSQIPSCFSPPPGWRFIILPPAPALEPPQQRRRLADNVVCMFDHDREPVVNIKKGPGRYPKGVERLRTWNRLHPGDYCILWKPARFESNRGIIVRLVEPNHRPPYGWFVRAVSRPAKTCDSTDPDNPAGFRESWEFITDYATLRRCAPPSGHRRAKP